MAKSMAANILFASRVLCVSDVFGPIAREYQRGRTDG
jgi:hypothetical protein